MSTEENSGTCFQMITPQQQKRQKILDIAKKEEDNYEKYMEEHRIKYVKEEFHLGGVYLSFY